MPNGTEPYRGDDSLKLDCECRQNWIVAWVSLAVGAATGLIMGLWSFDGPVTTPTWLGDYGDTSRRLARLGHIACFGLGILNILLTRELPGFSLSTRAKRTALIAMKLGNVFLPLTLFAAAVYHPLKYFMPVPALAVFLALAIAAGGVCRQKKEIDDARP